MSNEVRWSLDLRWQRAQDPDGLWGLKKPVLMRKKDDPEFKIDWTEFDSVDRHAKQKQAAAGAEMVGIYKLCNHKNYFTSRANKQDSDQPAHPRSLIRVIPVCIDGVCILRNGSPCSSVGYVLAC